MKNSAIQWTRHTHNPWLGCRKVAPECEKCYIVRQTPLRVRNIKHGSERHRCSEATRNQPLAWNRAAAKANEKHLVFCLSLGDWLDNEVPAEWLADLLQMIDWTPNLIWQLLTKRPQLWRKRMQATLDLEGSEILPAWPLMVAGWLDDRPPDNVWIGVSAGADQRAALDIPAKLHFLSCEPMLHPLDVKCVEEFDWMIFGGESEPGGEPRSTELTWIFEGLRVCSYYDIKPFVKQLGGRPIWRGQPFPVSNAHGDKMEEWPEDIRVREIPKL